MASVEHVLRDAIMPRLDDPVLGDVYTLLFVGERVIPQDE